jgi:hypothetical protein
MDTEDGLQRSVDTICVLIQRQFDNTIQNTRIPWYIITKESLGYIFGFVDGYQLSVKLQDMDTKIKMLNAVMMKIFGKQAGIDSTKIALEMQRNADFDKARKVGGQEAIDFLKHKTIPMGLSQILFDRSSDTAL